MHGVEVAGDEDAAGVRAEASTDQCVGDRAAGLAAMEPIGLGVARDEVERCT